MPGPVSPTSMTTSLPSARVDSRSVPAGQGVDGVVDEVGPHLVQLAGVCLDPRDVCAADGQPVTGTARLQLIVVLRWKLPGGRPGPRLRFVGRVHGAQTRAWPRSKHA